MLHKTIFCYINENKYMHKKNRIVDKELKFIYIYKYIL